MPTAHTSVGDKTVVPDSWLPSVPAFGNWTSFQAFPVQCSMYGWRKLAPFTLNS